MAQARHLESAAMVHGAESSFVAGVAKRLLWVAAVYFVTALSIGPLFAPASASDGEASQKIRITFEDDASGTRPHEGYDALKCRSEIDGRQEELLDLAQARLGGAPVEYVAARFWNERSGVAEVTFEFWHGTDSTNRKLYFGRGTVDMDSCAAELTELA
jgi:hypothetical protein